MIFRTTCLSLLACAFFAQPALAQNNPVEIEASSQLEWVRDQNLYRATGDVVITQGTMQIRAKQAEAHYDAEKGPSALTTMVVTGDVVLKNGEQTIHADKAEYDTRSEFLKLEGKQVKLTTQAQTVTAHNGMTYDAKARKATAQGRATVEQQGQKLTADTITAWIGEGNSKLQRAEANGNIVMVRTSGSEQDIAQANKAVYDAVKNTIDLSGNVRLTRGGNHMQGDSAHVDIATGHSTLSNNPATGGRVRAIFTPGGSTPLPKVNSTVPMVPGKKRPEQPYQVGVRYKEND